MKQFDEAFDGVRGTLADINILTTEAGGEFNETQEERANELLEILRDKVEDAIDKAGDHLDGLHEKRDIAQVEADKRNETPIESVESTIPADLQARLDKIGKDAADSIEASIERHTVKSDMRGNPGVTTADTGNVVDDAVHGATKELTTSEAVFQQAEHDGSKLIKTEGEGDKVLVDHNFHSNDTNVDLHGEVFPEGSSRNGAWDTGFGGEEDRYGIVDEYLSQSFSPDAAKPVTAKTGSITADAPADEAAHIAGTLPIPEPSSLGENEGHVGISSEKDNTAK